MPTPTAKSLILDLLATLRGGSMPVAALVAAGALFEMAESRMRVAVARLLAAGLLERDERGRYRLGAQAVPLARRAGGWRRLEERTRPWEGGWIGVHGRAFGAAQHRARGRREQTLRLLGFAALAPGLHVRPDNLRGGAAQARAELADLGLEAGPLVFALRELDPASDARARGLWDAVDLCAGYARSVRDLAQSERHLPGLSPEAAMVESFLLGGRVIRQLVRDPLLPEPIVPGAERRALLEAVRGDDRAGRRAWAPFLRGFGVVHAAAPADTRGLEGAGRPALH
jgi:phenylacetic acid degradation operon negative regulatory protein